MEELDDKVEDETQDHVEFGDDVEQESGIEAIVGALEPIEESDAIEVLATWKLTWTAMAQEKLNRGLRTPARQHSNSTPVAKNAPKPDLARLAGRTRCSTCREVGNFSRNCPKKCVQAPGNDPGVRPVSCDLKRNGGNALHWSRMRRTKATSRTQKFSECAIAQVVRYWTRDVRKHRLVKVLSSAKWKSVERNHVGFPTCAL